tara:strand:+ start:145 stop:363 length:219 start_codon:yes stop_codon:yes gene_type:complete
MQRANSVHRVQEEQTAGPGAVWAQQRGIFGQAKGKVLETQSSSQIQTLWHGWNHAEGVLQSCLVRDHQEKGS